MSVCVTKWEAPNVLLAQLSPGEMLLLVWADGDFCSKDGRIRAPEPGQSYQG